MNVNLTHPEPSLWTPREGCVRAIAAGWAGGTHGRTLAVAVVGATLGSESNSATGGLGPWSRRRGLAKAGLGDDICARRNAPRDMAIFTAMTAVHPVFIIHKVCACDRSLARAHDQLQELERRLLAHD